MKLSNIDQLLAYQDEHDKKYHADIYYQSTLFKLKHFTLHFSKYFARLAQSDRTVAPTNHKIMIDTLLITLSTINAVNAPVQDVNLKGRNTGIIVFTSYAASVEALAKSVDSLDHVESYPIKDTIIQVCKDLLFIVEQYIYNYSIQDFESLVINRYAEIRKIRLS